MWSVRIICTMQDRDTGEIEYNRIKIRIECVMYLFFLTDFVCVNIVTSAYAQVNVRVDLANCIVIT